MKRKAVVTYVALSALTIGVVYLMTVENVDVRVLRGVSQACQGTARIIGHWGLETERLYLALLENQRMV